MIIPSIDLMDGRAVQLRKGKEFVLDGGDPFERLEEFSVAGEVAVVDLDAAMGKGTNAPIMRELVRQAPCRVGGGIRDVDTALAWLDAGAEHVVIGTAASVDFCSQLPRDRMIAAVDAEGGTVVVEGWQTKTEHSVLDRITELAPVVGGFLLTQVEYEGGMSGWNEDLVAQAVQAAGSVRITAAGGITTAEDVGRLDRLGADAQVGMALYTNRMTLGDAVGAPLVKAIEERLWPTVVCDEEGHAIGLVWSTRESLEAAVRERRGIYWSRSRNSLWIKGETSGATQELLRVELDCDRDALRFVVRQQGSGFCHTGTPGCWPTPFTLSALSDVIARRGKEAPDGSGTAKLMGDPALLFSKLREETEELIQALQADDAGSGPEDSGDAGTEAAAEDAAEVIHEAADLLYFTLVAAASRGAGVEALRRELAQRSLRVRRRPMAAKLDEARPEAAEPFAERSGEAKPDEGENR
jgi:phosphoribosylformimino-5-aminoimidazole carboxamide ribonucleotide (ProFAR) isomerase/phosphoribosyl-ATP pyrophosphohydrolase